MLLVRPKSRGWFHSEFAQMLEFIDSFQLVRISFHVVRLPQGFWSMNLVLAGWLIPIRPVLHIVVLQIPAIVIGVFYRCRWWLEWMEWKLAFWGRSTLPSMTAGPMVRSIQALS